MMKIVRDGCVKSLREMIAIVTRESPPYVSRLTWYLLSAHFFLLIIASWASFGDEWSDDDNILDLFSSCAFAIAIPNPTPRPIPNPYICVYVNLVSRVFGNI